MKPGGYDLYRDLLCQLIRDVRKDLAAPKMPVVIGVMGIGGDKEGSKGAQLHFRNAQRAVAAFPEFKENFSLVETSRFWDDELDALNERREKLNRSLDQAERKDTKKKGAERAAERKQALTEHFTPTELKKLQGVSNGGYHYLGAAKILAPIGWNSQKRSCESASVQKQASRPDRTEGARDPTDCVNCFGG